MITLKKGFRVWLYNCKILPTRIDDSTIAQIDSEYDIEFDDRELIEMPSAFRTREKSYGYNFPSPVKFTYTEPDGTESTKLVKSYAFWENDLGRTII